MKPSRDERPIDWAATAGAVDDVLVSLDAKVRRRRAQRRRRLAAGAALGLLLIAGAVRFAPGFKAEKDAIAATSPSSSAAATTLVSHPEREVLPDGSIVELKPGARITVAFTESRRRVVLEEGEAHFQVTKNPQRPFVVVAGAVQFRAVGTAFSVQRGQREVELFVTEGRVAVDPPAAASPSTLPAPMRDSSSGSAAALGTETALSVVEAGHRVVVTEDSGENSAQTLHVVPVSADQASQRLAWRVPTLEFSGTPLSEALPLFERHGKIRLVLADPELAQVRLSGMIRADNIDTLIALLEDTHGIQAEKRGESEIILRKRR